MKKTILLLALIILFLLFATTTLQTQKMRQGHLTLLSVSSVGNMTIGDVADVELTIKPGTGVLYIDTFPTTELDTQISTRFAQEVACDITAKDCSLFDFFYTIRADTGIIGGPSASGAISALTAALLDNQAVDTSIAMTGTINSGGIIGPVGGINEKIQAAQDHGLRQVIIPAWQGPNTTLSYGDTLIEVSEVATLQEALTLLTKKNYVRPPQSINPPKEFVAQMKEVAIALCNRTREIEEQLESVDPDTHELLNQSALYIEKASNLTTEYYSMASYCYSANLRLREYQLSNYSTEKLLLIKNQVLENIAFRKESLQEKDLHTMTDLQTKAIVYERLKEAEEYLEKENLTAQSVAYALERYQSAVAWSNFFSLPGQQLQLDNEHLKSSCETKLAEVEERRNYLQVLLGSVVPQNNELKGAYEEKRLGEYALCLFKASKAKAEIDVIISTSAITDGDLDEYISQQRLLAEDILAHEMGRGRFSLMGHSYWEYSGQLRDEPYLAALFSAYSLELSDLSRYFPRKHSITETISNLWHTPFTSGFLVGVITVLFVLLFVPFQRSTQRRRTRRKP